MSAIPGAESTAFQLKLFYAMVSPRRFRITSGMPEFHRPSCRVRRVSFELFGLIEGELSMSDLTMWIHANERTLVPVAPYVTATVLALTFYGTIRVTRSQKKTDTAVEFGRTFIELMDRKHKLVSGQVAVPQAAEATDQDRADQMRAFLQGEALHYYAQFFAFQFSEFHAYTQGYVDKDVFTIWMKSRWRDFKRPETIFGVTYIDGWGHWKTVQHNDGRDKFVEFMKLVHSCDTMDEVDAVVSSFGPWWLRWHSWPWRVGLPERPILLNLICLLIGSAIGYGAHWLFGV